MVAPNEYQRIVKEVSTWPAEDRANLIQALLGMLRHSSAVQPGSLHMSDFLGIAKGEGPAPTDEQVKQWIDERRMEKYG